METLQTNVASTTTAAATGTTAATQEQTFTQTEAVHESKYKKFWVVSAYMEADRGTQAPNATSPGNTPNAFLASSPSAGFTVPQSGQTVKQKVSATDSTGAAPSGFDPLSHASNEYGAIPPGENPTRVVDFPTSMDGETKVRRYTRTAAEAEATTNEMVSRIEQLVADGELDYEVYSNKQAIRDGTKAIRIATTQEPQDTALVAESLLIVRLAPERSAVQ